MITLSYDEAIVVMALLIFIGSLFGGWAMQQRNRSGRG